jgi:acyl carrier protein
MTTESTSYAEVLHEIRRIMSERLARGERADDNKDVVVDETTRLDDIGVDSIDLVVVLTYFEQHLGLQFENEDVDIGRYACIGALARMISERVGG